MGKENANSASEADSLALAELLCARLCHDLAGPISAFAQGAELLADGGASGDDEVSALLADSAAVALSRLRFLRMALGKGGQDVAFEQFAMIVDRYFTIGGTQRDVRVEWRERDKKISLPAAQAKLWANILLVAEDCLKDGGRIVIAFPGYGAAFSLALPEGALRGQAIDGLAAFSLESLGPKGAQGFYARQLAAKQNCVIEVVLEGDVPYLHVKPAR